MVKIIQATGSSSPSSSCSGRLHRFQFRTTVLVSLLAASAIDITNDKLKLLLEVSVGSNKWKGLMEQDLSKLDVTKLHPLSLEVISRQATINIGTIGHVVHGKSTDVKAISGVRTV
ncbi:hypothetical protein QN277_028799 [Acacia crassicarpa]|uniref:Uncharacterized protein n=1 Tax=Acacia crassicarpa TaxID=499986 RepID=A0AAE1MK66_9FABA|nr:hypothetical protein QN277_028799 [Acacia crassicarpa]